MSFGKVLKIKLFFRGYFLYISGVKNTTYSTIRTSRKLNIHNIFSKLNIRNTSKKSKKLLIWVYEINNSTGNQQGPVKGAPFKTKTECANVLHINRSTVTAYLNSGKLLKNKWIFSYTALSKQELSKWVVPSKVWEIITGELLEDGHIRYDPVNTPLINGRIEFTFSAKILY